MEDLGAFFVDAYQQNLPKLRERYEEIKQTAEHFEKRVQAHFGAENVVLCLACERLQSFLTSYFYDIYRFKHFHGMLDSGRESLVNFPKIYAYSLKWWMREKPFYVELPTYRQIKHDEDRAHKLMQLADEVNEILAIYWVKESYRSHVGEKIQFTPRDELKLVYNLKYRDLATGILEIMLAARMSNEIVKQL